MIAIPLAFAVLSAAPDHECPEGTVLIEVRTTETATAKYEQPICEEVALYAPGFDEWPDFVKAMLAVARKNGWSREELHQTRLALQQVVLPANPPKHAESVESIWARMELQQSDAALAQAATSGQGPALFASGWQSGKYSDCVLFALATASGRPYGLVAANAMELLKSASWRSSYYRNNPEHALKEGGGLNDGEVILLAQSFGQASIVKPGGFAAALRAGKPVIVAISAGETDHEVVLSRAFRHAGSDWFELINSQADPNKQRLYVSAKDLGVILRSNGIVYQAKNGRSAPVLRSHE